MFVSFVETDKTNATNINKLIIATNFIQEKKRNKGKKSQQNKKMIQQNKKDKCSYNK